MLETEYIKNTGYKNDQFRWRKKTSHSLTDMKKNRARNMQAVPRLWYMCHESNQKEELGKISRGYIIIKSIISLFIWTALFKQNSNIRLRINQPFIDTTLMLFNIILDKFNSLELPEPNPIALKHRGFSLNFNIINYV